MTTTWILLAGLAVTLATASLALHLRQRARARVRADRARQADAPRKAAADARLPYPYIDLASCIGCGTCVKACPEEGVLDVVHGQALVVHGARCAQHGRCQPACPTGAIALTVGELPTRKDNPVLDEHLAARNVPGLYLAGEVTGFSLIRTSVEQGREAAEDAARNLVRARKTADGSRSGREAEHGSGPDPGDGDAPCDLLIVGAGPAGLACALQAQEEGLAYRIVDLIGVTGSVTRYPRSALRVTQPVRLPGGEVLDAGTWSKDEVAEFFAEVCARHRIEVESGVLYRGHARRHGVFEVDTDQGTIRARSLCLAIGRFGTPDRIEVPGEDLPKVSYSVLDAQIHEDQDLLVVGEGDRAVEAAIGLSVMRDNRITLANPEPEFAPLDPRNEKRMATLQRRDKVRVLHDTHLQRVEPDAAVLDVPENGSRGSIRIENDEVFVLTGGRSTFETLQDAGLDFEESDRLPREIGADRSYGLLPALLGALTVTLAVGAWLAWHRDYYALDAASRLAHPNHEWLRSSQGMGLALGVVAAACILANLCYLLRRSPRIRLDVGALRAWINAHLATGLLAFLATLLHAGFAPRDTVGGHALAALLALVATGGIGRYLYSFVPRSASGRELGLDDLHAELARNSAAWDRGNREFGLRVRDEIDALQEEERWRSGFLARLGRVLSGHRRLRARIARLRAEGRRQGIPARELEEILRLARRAFLTAMGAEHQEDLRGLMAAWRFFHRWIAILMVLLLAAHVISALTYGDILEDPSP